MLIEVVCAGFFMSAYIGELHINTWEIFLFGVYIVELKSIRHVSYVF